MLSLLALQAPPCPPGGTIDPASALVVLLVALGLFIALMTRIEVIGPGCSGCLATCVGAIGLFLVILFILTPFYALPEWYTLQLFGRESEGVVLSKRRMVDAKLQHRNRIDLEYLVVQDDGSTCLLRRLDEPIDEATYAQVAPGSRLPIRYLPYSPGVARPLAFWPELKQRIVYLLGLYILVSIVAYGKERWQKRKGRAENAGPPRR